MRNVIGSIEGEYRRYKKLGDDALVQLTDAQLVAVPPTAGNSIATIVWHVAGNLQSRFVDFLTSDGEKPWRDRESEFAARHVTGREVLAKWNEGWSALFTAIGALDDGDLERQVAIRGVPLPVRDALHRSLAHTSYHVGQIVFWAKSLRGFEWSYLTIPPGQSEAYRKNPVHEKPPRG